MDVTLPLSSWASYKDRTCKGTREIKDYTSHVYKPATYSSFAYHCPVALSIAARILAPICVT